MTILEVVAIIFCIYLTYIFTRNKLSEKQRAVFLLVVLISIMVGFLYIFMVGLHEL